jgi:hypothetical protein
MKKIFLFLFIIINWYSVSYAQNTPAISKEVLSDIIQSIPSSREMSFLMKDLGIEYDKNLLQFDNAIANYNTNYRQALNLGVYVADLGHSSIYEKTQDILYFLDRANEMAKPLKVAHLLDYQTIKKLANQNSKDSLLSTLNNIIEKVQERLNQKKRGDLSVLVLTGEWIEVLYLTCKIAQNQPNELLNDRIGEQKIILDQLLLLLSFYGDGQEIKTLINLLNELQTAYDKVKISYEYKEAETKDEGDFVIVNDSNFAHIHFTPEMLQDILQKVEKIRKYVID